MAQQMWFSAGGERVRQALAAALSWCHEFTLVSAAPSAADAGDGFWSLIAQHGDRAGALIVTGPAEDSPAFRALQGGGRLRRSPGESAPAHFLWFEREQELRLLLAPGALRESALTGPGVWLSWEGSREEVPEGLQRIVDGCRESSTAWDAPLRGPESSAPPAYARSVPSVREVLGIRSRRDFLELDPEDQQWALWSTLVGEGAVDLDQAIRLAADRLREQGFLDYQVLRQDGRVYGAIEEQLLAARRTADVFDRPRNGFVRAIERELEEMTAEQWRDCLMGPLAVGARVDRDEAVRLGFTYAQEVYGVEAQRLRTGGRADQALRSAINSSLRQGYLARDGAAYLVRVAGSAPPTLRGVFLEDAASTPPSIPQADVAVESEPPPPDPLVEAPAILDGPPAEPVESASPTQTAETPPVSGVVEHAVPAPPDLDRSLEDLDFPARTLNWAGGENIETVRELVKRDPEVFANARNVGRRTVRETHELLEAYLGCSWDVARAALQRSSAFGLGAGAFPSGTAATDEDVDSATEALTAGGASGWAALGARLTDAQRAFRVLELPLPTRMKNFVRGERLERLGDLFARTYASLANQANLGRKSLNDTLDAVRDYLNDAASEPASPTFVAAWQAQLAPLESSQRMIVTRRAGMYGNRETLEELGTMLGVTRERVRQIESRVIYRLRERYHWRRQVSEKVAAAFGAGQAVPLDLLAQDAWWTGIDQQHNLLDYVVRRIFEDELFLFEAPSGRHYLTRFAPERFAESLDSARRRVEKLEYPVELGAIHDILRSEVNSLDPILFGELEAVVGQLLHVDPEKPGIVLGHGRYRDSEVLAFLNGQSEPVPVALVEERCGRGGFPDEVLYFKRGFVGLKRHFPDFDAWMERLVPASLEVMAERPAGRQWLVPEIHDVLREKGLVPEWLGHWHLASLLRLSGRVTYLGRLRVATKDSGQEQRLHFEEHLEDVLRQTGGPLDFDDLVALARVRTDIGEHAAVLLVSQAPFVRLDDRRVGLVDRDIPGGAAAVAVAIEAVVAALTETERGLTPHQATLLVNGLSDVHATWSRPLVTSVLRNESTIRIDRSKNIGLDTWDDVRCPTRAEFLRREVQRAGGSMALADVTASLERVYGRAPDRSGLGVLANEVGLSISGGRIFRAGDVVEAPLPRPAINLSGIPTELRQLFEELMREPFTDLDQLRREIDAHRQAIEDEHRVNEFVDVPGARTLARQCHDLLDRWESFAPEDRRVVHAAVRYFVSWNDLENDFDIGGLDDDKQIMDAVLSHVGLKEEPGGALAS